MIRREKVLRNLKNKYQLKLYKTAEELTSSVLLYMYTDDVITPAVLCKKVSIRRNSYVMCSKKGRR